MSTEVKEGKFELAMTQVGTWIEKYIAPPLVKLGNQRHFAAIRAALIRTIPVIIIGSLPLILTNLPIPALAEAMASVAPKLNILFTMTFGFTSLYLAISIGTEMAKMYDELDVTTVSIVTVACYLITVSPVDLANGVLAYDPLSAKGMFAVFVCGIVVAEVMHFMYKYNLTIRMPKAVPKNVAASFSSLVPMAVLLVFFWVLRVVLNFNIYELINMIISPLLIISDTWYAALICSLLWQLLWFVGIHGGSFTVWGVMYPFLLANMAANSAAAQAGAAIPHIITEPFFYSFACIGGVGITLPLVIIWLRSKSVMLRDVARVSILPAIFCINEPVLFGAPIVLNPIMLIPFVFLTTLLGTLYGYVLTALGWISPAIVQVPWTTPPLFQPFLSTGDWRNVVAQLVLIILMFVIWYPFAKIWEKRCLAMEAEGEK
jgi:PTS system cellobiose-specific IIC component